MIDVRAFIESVASYSEASRTDSATRTPRLGNVDPAYATGMPKISFDGDNTLSPSGFARLASYTPVANDRVALLPVGNTYVILGKVV